MNEAVIIILIAAGLLVFALLPERWRVRALWGRFLRNGLPVAASFGVALPFGLLLEFSPLKVVALAYAVFLTCNWFCERFEVDLCGEFRSVVPRWINVVLFAATLFVAFLIELDGGMHDAVMFGEDPFANLPSVRVVSLFVVGAVAAPYLLTL